MQIILLERVAKLGQMGEVVSVRDGYARNYLIPRGKALRATDTAVTGFEKRRQQLETRNLELKGDAQRAGSKIEGRSVVIIRQASETAQLYGSVSARDIAAAFTSEGVAIDKSQIRLDQPLKTLGLHDITLALHPEVEVIVKVNIARSAEEADSQAGKPEPAESDENFDEGLADILAL